MTRRRGTRSRQPQITSGAEPLRRAHGWIGTAACALVAVAAFVFGLHKIDDFDTWWHLASGRWIAAHRAIPAMDTLSHTVRDHAWINLQWGFDLVLYFLYSRGGAALVCVAGAIVFLAAIALLTRLIALRVAASLAAPFALLVVLTAEERVTLRPELLSFLLLAAVLFVIEQARRAEGRWAFLLVPLMIVWANVHALFVLGAFAIVCGLVGTLARPPRRLLVWSGVALASVIVNPFGLRGALFPLKLVSRINGSSAVFQTVGEFGSPLAPGAAGVSVIFYKALLVLGVVAAAAALIATLRSKRRFDWGGLIFFAGLAVLSAAARRNVAIFAIGSAPFIARCLEILLASYPSLGRQAARRASFAAAAAAIAAVLASAAVITGAIYKFDNSPQEFGAGVIEGTFPARAAAFARAAGLPKKLYNDMAGGGYLAWDDPIGDGVFVDGRLEVYDTPFLTEYVTAESDPVRWQADADRYGIQTAIIFHRFENERALAGRLARSDAWSLVYVDEVAAIFVRTEGNDAALARAASVRAEWDQRTGAWLARPATRWPYPAGRIEGTRAYARVLATVGRAEPAIAAYLKLLELGISPSEEVERRLLLARYFASHGRQADAQEQARRILVIDPQNAEAPAFLR